VEKLMSFDPSLRANLLRRDITPEELRALADFFFA
jgi:hypothetical protein